MIEFGIGGALIGKPHKPYIIAEIAQAHDGSLGYAYSFVDLAKEIGADAIKFQTHISKAESTWDEEFRVNIFPQDKTRYEYWQRMEFTPDQWARLFEHAKNVGIEPLSSAFSIKAVQMLDELGINAWKVASGEISNLPLLEAMCETKKPVLLSSGLSSYEEINRALDVLEKQKVQYALFQCTSKYPTPIEEVGINILSDFMDRYGCPIGLSDHSANPYVPITAMAKGASMIEAHLCLHPHQFGPDTGSSLTPEQFKMVCEARDVIYTLNSNFTSKNEAGESLKHTKALFNKSLSLKEDQKAGTLITEDMLTLKKPGTGIPLEQQKKVIGRTLKSDKSCERLLHFDDFKK